MKKRKKKICRDSPGGPVVRAPHFHSRGHNQVQSLVGELRSRMLRGTAKKKDFRPYEKNV